jgi:hypothetical protein
MAATGIVFSAARLSSTGASAAAERLERRAAEGCLRFLPLFLCLAYLAMGVGGGWSGALLFVLGSALEGIIDPVLQFEINRAIPSAQRATVLSLLSAGFSGMMTVTFPAASYLRPVTRIYLVTGALGSMLAGIWAFRWRPGSGTGADRREPLPAREASGP